MEELSGWDLTPAVVATLAKTGRISVPWLARFLTPCGVERFVALVLAAPTAARDDLWEAASALPKARVRCLAALLALFPERHVEVMALVRELPPAERSGALWQAFPHLGDAAQAWALAEIAALRERRGPTNLVQHVRPGAFRAVWDRWQKTWPDEVQERAGLLTAAPRAERANLVSELLPALRRSSSQTRCFAGRHLLPHAAASDRPELLDLVLAYADHYQASYVGHSLGDALREPEVEARYVALLDAGEFDYKWDLAKYYARVARLEGKLAAHCRERARQLLNVVLHERGNEEVRFDCLLHVTVALHGPEREQRELEVLEMLRRIGPEIESEEEFLAAWEPAAELDPSHAPTLLELIDAIGNDYNALDAFARIAAVHPPFQAECIERLVARFERRVPNESVSTSTH